MKSYVGKSSFSHLEDILKKISPKELFIVTGKNSYEDSGAKKMIDKLTCKFNIKTTQFADFSKNPKIEDLENGLQQLNATNAEMIIAIGGGSVLDMAKLIRFKNSYEGKLLDNDVYLKKKGLLPLVAIPTTAGTGSEATHFAVLYKGKVKYSVAHPDILPDYAIVDPAFTYTNSPYLAACSGFDALAQAIEAYWNIHATPQSDEFALKAIALIYPNLLSATQNDLNAKDKVAEGAFWAGKAINITKTTAPHAMSYFFTSYYDYPHGHAVALTFPFFLQYNIFTPYEEYNGKKETFELFQEKMSTLRDFLGFRSDDQIETSMKKYIKSLGLSFEIPGNIDKELAIKSINYQRAQNNPRILTEKISREVLDSIN